MTFLVPNRCPLPPCLPSEIVPRHSERTVHAPTALPELLTQSITSTHHEQGRATKLGMQGPFVLDILNTAPIGYLIRNLSRRMVENKALLIGQLSQNDFDEVVDLILPKVSSGFLDKAMEQRLKSIGDTDLRNALGKAEISIICQRCQEPTDSSRRTEEQGDCHHMRSHGTSREALAASHGNITRFNPPLQTARDQVGLYRSNGLQRAYMNSPQLKVLDTTAEAGANRADGDLKPPLHTANNLIILADAAAFSAERTAARNQRGPLSSDNQLLHASDNLGLNKNLGASNKPYKQRPAWTSASYATAGMGAEAPPDWKVTLQKIKNDCYQPYLDKQKDQFGGEKPVVGHAINQTAISETPCVQFSQSLLQAQEDPSLQPAKINLHRHPLAGQHVIVGTTTRKSLGKRTMDGNLLNKRSTKLHKTGSYASFNDVLADLSVGNSTACTVLNSDNDDPCRSA
ncbi:hypothetical protein MCOR29_007224 [Pyricularia oryzae]|nr:hypothetical protein MCOR29_007224 [Pyricularia oryzae]KAI6395733.1 hypothetical protein MCOR20_010138 [Pyricularia oryzae]KAI6430212.1 hypothetical protein MCOR21_004663 [Pyricularia oryzae]KAI6575515.1 hypothetical protein MCOR09_001596 [Pyricularia oryzae]KAI6601234.1 hypothetical protein MCOR06_000428 [Pyricularia oryzae]